MNTAACNCQTQTSKPNLNERPRYYARQLVTPDDMTQEQDYFRTRLRRHNRYLHGWGVVCGAQVVPATKRDAAGALQPQPWKVIVKTGFVLGPYGDEIFIETDQCVDVRKKCMSPETPDDNECLDAPPTPPQAANETRFLAIRYVESKTRLIRVPLGGCGCEDNTCEYSRFADNYEICVIDDCPDSHKNPRDPDTIPGIGTHELPGCPECESQPWVVLSAFTVRADGTVELQQCDCRRQVLSLGGYWWTCLGGEQPHPKMDEALITTTDPTASPASTDPAASAASTNLAAPPAPAKPAAKPATKPAAKPATKPAAKPAASVT